MDLIGICSRWYFAVSTTVTGSSSVIFLIGPYMQAEHMDIMSMSTRKVSPHEEAEPIYPVISGPLIVNEEESKISAKSLRPSMQAEE